MQTDYVLDYDVISVAREQRLFMMARIQGKPAPASFQRRSLNLSVVLDRSGSMGGDKISYVCKAAQFLVDHLGSSDKLSVVAYDDRIEVVIPPGAPVMKDSIKQAIEKLTARGSTNLSGGWLQGCQFVAEGQQDGHVNRVLLLTDGLANQGITDPTRLITLARQKYEEGISTTTMGVGMDFNEDLLVRMASEGGGAFYFIDNPDQAPSIFSEELKDLLSVVGQNLTVTLIPLNGVQMVRQLNTYPKSEQNGNSIFRLGDLFADELKALVLELTIPGIETMGSIEVARLRFEYDEFDEDRVEHIVDEMPVIVNAVPALDDELRAPPHADVQRRVLLLRAARARDTALEHADRGEFEEASQVLTGVADDIEASGVADGELQAEHDMLREAAVDMALGDQRYDSHTRKTHSTQSFISSTRSARFFDLKLGSHQRLKESRESLERHGPTPSRIRWQNNQLLLTADRITIGRAAENDIVLDDDMVSKHHCQIVRQNGDFILQDLNSANGTFANGGVVRGNHRLSAGDVVTVGPCLFILSD